MSLDNVHEHLAETWTSLQSAADSATMSHEGFLDADAELAEIERLLGTVAERLGALGTGIDSAWHQSAESQQYVNAAMQSGSAAAEEFNGGDQSILGRLAETIAVVHRDGGDRLGMCIGMAGRHEASVRAVTEAVAAIALERRSAATAAVGATAQLAAVHEVMGQAADAKTAIGAE